MGRDVVLPQRMRSCPCAADLGARGRSQASLSVRDAPVCLAKPDTTIQRRVAEHLIEDETHTCIKLGPVAWLAPWR